MFLFTKCWWIIKNGGNSNSVMIVWPEYITTCKNQAHIRYIYIYIYILSILGLVGKTIILKDSVRRSNWVFSQPWKWVRINWTIFRVCLQSMPDIFWSRLVMRLMGCFCLLFFIKIEFCLFHGQELLILKLILSYLALSWLWKDSGRMG